MDINRRISWKGRKNLAYAHWSRGDQKNVITYFMNMIGKYIKALEKEIGGMTEDVISVIWTGIDFHEWLHLFIRRESGLTGTYMVTDSCEAFICCAQEELDLLMLETWTDVNHLDIMEDRGEWNASED